MHPFSFEHTPGRTLLSETPRFARGERKFKAALIARIAEIDRRRLYRQAGYPSTFAYCVGELHLSKASAYHRLQVARVARRFPRLFTCIEEGALDLTNVLLLRPHLTGENADELIEAASHKSKAQIRELLAERFGEELAPELVGRCEFIPVGPGLCEMRVIVRTRTVDRVRHVQDLMSHQNPTRNMAVVMDRMLDLTIPQLEKRKFASTDRPGVSKPAAEGTRYIPADVRRMVYQRDGGQCVFISPRGKRCESRHQLEFDHIVPVAKGGASIASNLRLLCRPHNCLAAEQTYGLAFMGTKIDEARAEGDKSEAQLAPELVPELPPELVDWWKRPLGGEVAAPSPAPHHAAP